MRFGWLLFALIFSMLFLNCDEKKTNSSSDKYLNREDNYDSLSHNSFDGFSDLLIEDVDFQYSPVGKLTLGSGRGVLDTVNHSPNMRFPLESFPAYCNSQVYGYGGYYGPISRFGWKDQKNYSYPWVDNFCEKRSKYNCCPGQKGHQGQDIRPATYHDKTYQYFYDKTKRHSENFLKRGLILGIAQNRIYNFSYNNAVEKLGKFHLPIDGFFKNNFPNTYSAL